MHELLAWSASMHKNIPTCISIHMHRSMHMGENTYVWRLMVETHISGPIYCCLAALLCIIVVKTIRHRIFGKSAQMTITLKQKRRKTSCPFLHKHHPFLYTQICVSPKCTAITQLFTAPAFLLCLFVIILLGLCPRPKAQFLK